MNYRRYKPKKTKQNPLQSRTPEEWRPGGMHLPSHNATAYSLLIFTWEFWSQLLCPVSSWLDCLNQSWAEAALLQALQAAHGGSSRRSTRVFQLRKYRADVTRGQVAKKYCIEIFCTSRYSKAFSILPKMDSLMLIPNNLCVSPCHALHNKSIQSN